MLTCIARSKHPGDDSLNQDPNATPTTKQSLKSLTYQIKDMAWKASGAYRNCTPCTGAMTTQHRQKSCRGGESNLALDQRFRWSHRRTASLNSASTAGSRQWGKEMEERLKGMSSGEGTPAASASGRRVDPVVFVEEHEPKEWVAQVDSGVLITFVSMPRGGNDLKRIRFSREKYNKWQAQRWWTENYDRVMELYNVQRLNRQAFPLPPTPPRSEAESIKMGTAEDNTPATPPLRNEHHPLQSRYNYDSGLTSTPEISSISGAKTETSSVDASLRTSSSREADRSGEISVSNGSGLETEWVEEDEPGVYITIRALPGRKRELRRVRFSREKFGEMHARLWWEENRARFKIALCQLLVTADKERNIAHARKAIEEAAQKGAQLVVLPEIWNSPYSNASFPVYAEDIDAGGDASPSTMMLSELSRSLQITVVGGSIPERSGDKLYNTCCVFGSDGKLKAKHRKVHLFDIDIPGQITFKESLTLTGGESPTIVDTDVGRIGIGICYDIRFQELAMLYAARGAHLICYPGAFNMVTGPLHWELLQRARAMDCQLFVATCSPARDASAGYVAWGHSTLVGPFGEVMATTEHDEAIVVAEIDYSLIDLRRTNLPFQKQRRGDLYQLVDVQRLKAESTK
ncbi:hypothetical protein RHSIM_Rhsim03G0230100 [Rhododendron simsii]|uniref:Nitrilase/cyanide hydratase and apolipoprotein N-acyltransferase family protein n=1 Tax=Rhododendron simsii TaxID=118357 RepID=A0A834LUV6_RHOSS|nr:hypothetical protein RHSIM_Rhsim03G0230100 [Rhododendron simsii]